MVFVMQTTKEPTSFEYKKVITTLFWVGEESGPDNANISNYGSWWQSDWQSDFGGIDDPDDRCGFQPCDFTPKENPFYFALPYSDTDDDGKRKDNARDVPWFNEYKDRESIVKNRWVEIVYNKKICYAQWEDVGPLETDDFDYVFSDGKSINTFGVNAGIDISPATWTCLGLEKNDEVEWRFISDDEVPYGPWKEIVTTGDVKH